jgi:hypothetical protein
MSSQGDMLTNGENNANYAPINPHPNPYGNALQPHDMPMPQTSPPKKDLSQGIIKLSQQDQDMIDNTPRIRLPSRDLPMDEDGYLHDEEITANYIPKVRFKDDYVKDYENVTTEKFVQRENNKKRESYIDNILNDLQVPILITMLYFLFQLPLINTMFFKKFAFLSIYNIDGNINFYGIALKSIIFGGLFYILQKTVNVLTDF